MATLPFVGAPDPEVRKPQGRVDPRNAAPRWVTHHDDVTQVPEPSSRFEPGQVVPATRYRVVQWLGEGGMGVVYEAEHLDIERRVALKILRSDIKGNSAAAQQFRDEARAASKVGSENIAEIFDFAELPDGRLLFAMELLDGTDLFHELDDGPMLPARAIPILRQMCKGLAAAHSKGIVHRDVKPENVLLVTRDGRPDLVKLVDFGISTMLAGGRVTQATQSGTPHYLAPEIVDGVPFDERVDMYALGCMAYEMVTGTPPFLGDSLFTILKAHVTKAPVSPRKIRKDNQIPKSLERVILRCLAKDADARYVDMLDLEAALCEAQIAAGLRTVWDDLPVPEVDPARQAKIEDELAPDQEVVVAPQPRRRSMLWPVMAGAGFAAAAGLAYVVVVQGNDEAEAARTDEVEALVNAARAAGARTHYVYPPRDDPDQPTALGYVLALEQVAGRDAAVAQAAAASLRAEFAETLVYLAGGYWERDGGREFAIAYYEQALMFDEGHALALERAEATPDELATLRHKAEKKGFTQEDLDQAPTIAESDEEEQPTRRAERRPKKAVRKRATVKDKKAEPEPSRPAQPAKAPDFAAQGRAARKAGKVAEAERLFKAALASNKANRPALAGLSEIAFDRGHYNLAAKYAKKAVAVAPNTAVYRILLGDALFKLGNFTEAKRHYERAAARGHSGAKWRLEKVNAKLGD